jgi:multidrug efflux pump subunit AcrA (membrane-fusion protein)
MLSSRYLDNRLAELSLVYEYSELEQKIKEEQAAIRQQEREDEKARREAERRERDAANREAVAQKALEEAQAALGAATDRDADEYRRQIAHLERQLAEAREEKQRAKSLAEQTRAGYVYIFSNVGSFGDNVYKIGMTRREDPEDRRRELGDASVPFPFDCHAYIWTEDAPSLERALHVHFDGRRLNLENPRKEFFRLNIDEIQKEIDELKITLGIDAEIRWTLLAEAKDYRMSEAKRKHLEASFRQPIVDPSGTKDDLSI